MQFLQIKETKVFKLNKNKFLLHRSFNVDAEAILAVACSVTAIGCFLFSFRLSDDADADRRTFQRILDDMLR